MTLSVVVTTIRMCTTISHGELSGNHGQLLRAAVALVMRPTMQGRKSCVSNTDLLAD